MFHLEKSCKIVNNVCLLVIWLCPLDVNNWTTEKFQKLSYGDGRTSKWEHIKTLYGKEKNAIVKLSKLTETAVSPKPAEHQNVLLSVKVFCDERTAALKLQNGLLDHTIEFLTKLVKFLKIANVKGRFKDVHTKEGTRAVLLCWENVMQKAGYACLGHFSSHPTEKMFDKLRRYLFYKCLAVAGKSSHLLKKLFRFEC